MEAVRYGQRCVQQRRRAEGGAGEVNRFVDVRSLEEAEEIVSGVFESVSDGLVRPVECPRPRRS